MNFIKTLAAAAVLAAVSAPALAGIKAVNGGGSELFLVVADENGSFMLDTGMTLNDVLSSTSFSSAVAGAAWSSYIAADTNLFDGASNSNTGTRWALFVYDGNAEADYSLQQVATTLGKGLTAASITFDALTMNGAWGATGNVGQLANGSGTHPTLANGSSYNQKGTNGYAGSNFFKFGPANTFIGNKVGDSSSLYLIKGDAADGSDPFLPVVASQLALTVNFDGQTLTVSAVPEPQAYALMVAGLAAVGFVARRRRSV